MFKKILVGLGIIAAVGLVIVIKPFTGHPEEEPEPEAALPDEDEVEDAVS